MKVFGIFILLIVSFSLSAQDRLGPSNGTPPSKTGKYVLTHATVYVKPGEVLENVNIVIEEDRIVSVGKQLLLPKDAVEIDCSGKVIVPAFLDAYASVGVPAPKQEPYSPWPQLESNRQSTFYWNEAVHPETSASENYEMDTKENKRFHEMGFGFAVTHADDGIAQGSGALVSLGSSDLSNRMIQSAAAAFFSLDKGVSRQTYPSSQMGSIALVRQLFYDLEWYRKNKDPKTDLSLRALDEQMNLPLFFKTEDKFEALRVVKVGKEFGLPFVIFGSGQEYAYAEELKAWGHPLVIPLAFPKPYDVGDPYVARHISLGALREWEMAPFNPRILFEHQVPFSFTASGCEDAKTFWKNLRKAIEHGLPLSEALAALTVNPAKILHVELQLGTLEEGRLASFTVFDKDPFREEASALETWNLGDREILEQKNERDIRGKYNILLGSIQYPFIVEGTVEHPKAYIRTIRQQRNEKTGLMKNDTLKIPVKMHIDDDDITMHFSLDDEFYKGSIQLHGKIRERFGVLEGDASLSDGRWVQWSAIKNEKFKEKKDSTPQINDSIPPVPGMRFPDMAFGRDSLSDDRPVVIRNATIWTNEETAVIKDGTLILKNGKISYVGNGNFTTPQNAIEIDAKGKFVTSGIIDEHSHIAISKGVNEGGQANSAEVSIADVVNPEDINIYRQLSGGVTAAQLLHGSANPIGGQSALVKLKWGYGADEMLIPNAPKFIKFALGENVKQSNWGDYNTVRFPQTRMGVEQVYIDAFDRALKYHEARVKGKPKDLEFARRDLELEVLWEILEGKRFVTCHSYIQSEINMLMHVADTFGFRINTFTHILEGYKVADKMAAHGAAGSTFSDWWAYKYEVRDAIPYNAKIMYDQGVLVAINSDDAEMGRRLNQEAAKTMKYGGMPELEAWKLVTLNPAKMLHLDDRMGSLREGKDADVVIWSANPLSILARVEYTIVDGEILYSSESYEQALIRNRQEKARIITAMLLEMESGEKPQAFARKKETFFHCDTLGEEGTTSTNQH